MFIACYVIALYCYYFHRRVKPAGKLKAKAVASRPKPPQPAHVEPPTTPVVPPPAPAPVASQEEQHEAEVTEPSAQLLPENLARAQAAGKAAVLSDEKMAEAPAYDAIKNMVKTELFDDEGYLLPSIAALLADKKETEQGSSSIRPVGQTLTILNLEDNCDELYVTMKESYKALKKMMKVNDLSPYNCFPSPQALSCAECVFRQHDGFL